MSLLTTWIWRLLKLWAKPWRNSRWVVTFICLCLQHMLETFRWQRAVEFTCKTQNYLHCNLCGRHCVGVEFKVQYIYKSEIPLCTMHWRYFVVVVVVELIHLMGSISDLRLCLPGACFTVTYFVNPSYFVIRQLREKVARTISQKKNDCCSKAGSTWLLHVGCLMSFLIMFRIIYIEFQWNLDLFLTWSVSHISKGLCWSKKQLY